MEIYKSKIDAFINYDIYNKLGDNDDEESDQSKGSKVSKKSEDSVIEYKKQFTSVYEKYNRITENLISQIKVYIF